MSPVLTSGVATFALLAEPDVPHNGRSYLTVEKDAAEVYVYIPMTGKPEASDLGTAILRLSTDGAWGLTPTVSVAAADGFWTGSQLTWNASPGVTGTPVTESHASAADADVFELDVTTLAAAMLLDGNYGFVIKRTDAGASKAFYGFGSLHPPSLELTWEVTPTPPTILKPSGGRVVATPTPPLAFDVGPDCTHIQVQVAADGDFGSPDFDSGMILSTEGKFYLEGTAYTPVGAGVDTQWRAQWRNTSSIDSGYSPPAHMTYRAYPSAAFLYPSDAGGGIVTSDDPTILWDILGGSQSGYRVTVADASTPLTIDADSKPQPGAAGAWAVPQGAILDSSPKIATLTLRDVYDREAVEGFPVELTLTQVFQFQPTAAIPPPDTFTATQIGTSPFILLAWTRSAGRPDSWQIRRNEGIIAGAKETTALRPDADGVYRWIDYTAPGNSINHYRVGAKVAGKVSSGGPTQDVITQPKGKWLGDPTRGSAVLLGGQDLDDWDMGEVSAMYYPLRGTDAVQVTQSQRGYEGPVTGDIKARDGISAGEYYNALMAMRRNPDDTYVVAYPFVAFFATFRQIKANLISSVAERWKVEIQMAQQGHVVWLHGQSWLGSTSELLAEHDYEEGTDGATLTTSTDVGALATGGAAGWPKYEADEAIHGAMGFQIPASASGGWVEYEIPYIFAFSIYLTPRSSSGSGSLAQLRPAFGAGTCAEFTLRSGGDLSIADQDGHTVDGSRTHGVYGWVADKKMRVDGIGLWDDGELTLYGRIFTSPEANNASDELGPVTFPCTAAPGRLRVGNGSASKHTGYDSVRVYAGSSTWPAPLVPDTTEWLWSVPGDVTPTGATIRSRVLNTETIDLAVSTTLTAGGDPATPAYYGPSNDGGVDENGLVEHNIADQAAGTTYYAKLSTGPGSFIGDLMQWTTKPAIGAASTTKIALVSCQRNFANSQSQLAWIDMLAWGPNTVLFIGDMDYQGGQYDPSTPWETMLEAYTSQLVGLPAMRQQLARAETVILEDDHAFSANNGDSNESTDTGKVRATNIFALQQMFPMYPLADDRAADSKRSLSGSVMFGKQIRLIYLDSESLDRSLSTDTDNSSKTFIGTEGDAFLRAELIKPAGLNIIVCPKALIGDEAHGTPDADQVWNYNTWRTSLASFIAGTSTTDGKDIFVYWWGGDRHANAYVSGANNPVMAGHPALLSSGVEQFALDQRDGEEDYDDSYGYGDHTLDIPVVQYVQVTITDTPGVGGAGTIAVAIKSRECENTWSGSVQTDPTTWVMSDGFTASDSWPYTAAPGELLAPWAGDATQTTCEVTALTLGATSVSLIWANNPGMTGATTVAGGAPDGTGLRKFQITGLSAGQTYYYRFLDTFTGHFTNSPIGEVYSFKTPHAAGAATFTTKLAVGSCGQTAPMNRAVWDDILSWSCDRLVHLGDFGYPGFLNTSQSTHKQNWATNMQDPGMNDVRKTVCMDYVISDHDVNGHHGTSNAPNYHDATSQANMDAWVAVVPARVVDVRSPIRARYRSYVEGKVRHVLLDTRSWDKTDVVGLALAPDSTASTMLGSTQRTWLQAEIDAAQSAGQVIVLWTDPAWNGLITEGNGMTGGVIDVSYSDKWPAYSYERDIQISKYASDRSVHLFIVHGDSHGLQADDGTNEAHGHAAVCLGPFDQNPHMHFQDKYQFSYPAGVDEGGGKQPQIQCYGRLTINQTPTTVQIIAELRDCSPAVAGTPSTVHTLTKNY